jgi:hypothetical protein
MKGRSKNIIAQRKKTTRGLFFLNAMLWLVYCIFIYYDMAVVNNNGISAGIAVIFLFVMAVLMFIGGIMLNKQPRQAYYPALLLIVLNILFTLMNLSNLLYLAAFVIDIVTISLLFSLREDYLSAP